MQDRAQLEERIHLYFKKPQKDYDEFDNIILQLTMLVMHSGDLGYLEGLERLDEIKETFMRRASRREFATVKYLVYLQFAGIVSQDAELLDDLIRYGFDHLYGKL